MKQGNLFARCAVAALAAALLLSSLGCKGGEGDNTQTDTQPETAAQTQTQTEPQTEAQTQPGTEAETEPDAPPVQQQIQIYVSPNGSDEGDGSRTSPYATVQKAVDSLPAEGEPAPYEIILMDGDYYLTEAIAIGGEANAPVFSSLTIRAENTGKAKLIGGVRIDPALCKPVTDSAILDRLVDPTVADKLMMVDLNGIVSSFPGYALYNPSRISYNGVPLEISRWPNNVRNEAFLYSEAQISQGEVPRAEPMVFTYKDDTNRALQWSEEGIRDLYILSYLAVDWINDPLKVTAMDPTTRTVTTENGGTYGVGPDKRFFFFNILEEIDVPGEVYTDKNTGIMYFYPPEEPLEEMYISVMGGSMLTMSNLKNVTVSGITFGHTRGRAIQTGGMENLTITDCVVNDTGDMAMSLGGNRITVDGCEISHTWGGGISMSGGDRQNLVASGNVIKNCVIHDVNGSYATYKPAIWAAAVGMEISNNLFYNATHMMIKVDTNDVVITRNEFHDCLTDSSDMGVIYFGRDPSLMGVVISYNYFHDNGNKYGGIGQFAIYVDDGNAGAHIHHNVFHNVTPDFPIIRFHAAQHSLVEYNLFSDAPCAIDNAQWTEYGGNWEQSYEWLLWLYDLVPTRDHDIRPRIENSGMDSDLWREHYKGTIWEPMFGYLADEIKEAMEIYRENDKYTRINKILYQHAPERETTMMRNIFVNIDQYDNAVADGNDPSKLMHDGILQGGYSTCGDNRHVNEEDFVAYGTDFALTEDGLAKVHQIIPGFENFSMDKVGPQKD